MAKKEGVMPTIKKERLEKAAKDLNASLDLNPPIKFNSKSTFAFLKKEIEEVANELLKDGDTLTQETVDTLLALEIDVPGKIKIVKNAGAKKDAKKDAKKESKKSAKKPGELSNKGKCYLEWKRNQKITPETLMKMTKDNVKLTTIKVWVKAWAQGKNLPAVANEK